jgi:hypothetical protein
MSIQCKKYEFQEWMEQDISTLKNVEIAEWNVKQNICKWLFIIYLFAKISRKSRLHH